MRTTPPSFWLVEPAERSDASFAWLVDGDTAFESIECTVDPGHRRGGRRLTDLSIILPRNELRDVIWTWYSDMCATDRVVDALIRNEVMGYAIRPMRVRRRRPRADPLPRLWELRATGFAGEASAASGFRRGSRCTACGYCTYEVRDSTRLIDPERWDGSDLFFVWPFPGYVFVTSKVVDLFATHEFVGCRFIPAGEVDQLVGTNIAPGELEDWRRS